MNYFAPTLVTRRCISSVSAIFGPFALASIIVR
jgi:hypothetical protein